MLRDLAAVLEARSRRAGIPCPGWLSYDNAGAHNGHEALLRTLGLQRVPLSPHSPDIHKVIEHTFARFKRRVAELLYAQLPQLPEGRRPSLAVVAKVVADALKAAATRDAIAGDVASLPHTLQIIATERLQEVELSNGRVVLGSGGDWPPKGFR